MALPRKNRITKKAEFKSIFKEGKAVKGSFLFIKLKDSQKDSPRFGFSIPKNRVAKSVDRSRLKRVLGETVRNFIRSNPDKNYDIIVVINKNEKEDLLVVELTKLLNNI